MNRPGTWLLANQPTESDTGAYSSLEHTKETLLNTYKRYLPGIKVQWSSKETNLLSINPIIPWRNPVKKTTLRSLCSQKGLKVGTFMCEFNTPGIGYILKNGGCDYVFIDMEHSGFDVSTLKTLLRYFEAADLPAFVRPAGKDYYDMARVLDVGAEGLILPMVGTAAEAARIVNDTKYEPLGARGVALAIAHDQYQTGPVIDKLNAANQRTHLFPLIETRDGIDNIETIANTDGIDGLWLGHFDLSCSLGIPGQFDHSEFKSSVDKLLAAASAAGKPVGRVVANSEEGVAAYKQGFDFIAVSGDCWLLQDAMTRASSELRAGCC